MKPTLIVLAAGMGSRYGGLKQLDALGPSGGTIMDYTIFDAVKAGFGKVIFVIRRDMEDEFRKIVLDKIDSGISTEIVFQDLDDLPDGLTLPEGRKKPWGTAHALWVCRNAVDTPFAMVNADDFYGRASLEIMSQFLSEIPPGRMAVCMVGYELKNTLSDFGFVSRGICKTDENGYLLKIEERTDIRKEDGRIFYLENGRRYSLTGKETASMNLIGFTPEVFDGIEKGFISFFERNAHKAEAEYYVPEVLKVLIGQGVKIPVLTTSSEWFGVTYKKDKEVVQEALLKLHHQGMYPPKLH